MKFLRKFPYWYLLAIPALLFAAGVASNQVVLVANHGKFPVAMNAMWMDKFCSPPVANTDDDAYEEEVAYIAHIPTSSCKKGGEMIDDTHSVMGPNSHFKALADIFPLGHAIYSVGDGLLYLGDWLLSFTPIMWLALTIRKLFVTS
jgi:hypothetical protein